MPVLIQNGSIAALDPINYKMKKNVFILAVLVAFFASCSKDSETIMNTTNSVGTSGRALDQLARGLNLSNWFNDYSDKAQFATRFNSGHFTQIKNAGFTYVRLPVGPSVICDPSNISNIQPANLTFLDQAIRSINAAGLAVAIEIHSSNAPFEIKLATDPVSRVAFRQFWKNLATSLKKYDTTQLFFEIYNEPHVGAEQTIAGIDKNWWSPFQLQIIQSIREAAPEHYIIAGAENWNNWYDLTLLQPYNIKNVVYNFHLYDPFAYTHQGAEWVGDPYNKMKAIPYPANPGNMAPLVAAASTTTLKNLLSWHGNQRYNIDSMNLVIKQVYLWANRNSVPVICNEFGVYKKFASSDSRVRYLQDMHNTLAKYKMGWAVWEYDESFGLTSYPTITRTGVPNWDTDILNSLGLK